MGERLAGEAPVEADLVMPIPDSGTPAAVGFARASGIPYSEGLIKNRYVGRTFIEPDEDLRRQGIKMKFNPLAEVAGKRLVIVDDSIVRGSTMRQLVAMLFDAGAAEVHVRISSPPIVSPCFYGIDMADEAELAAAHRSVEQMRELIGATSLHYLSLEGMQSATRLPEQSVCRACFTRSYPTRVPAERTWRSSGSSRPRAGEGRLRQRRPRRADAHRRADDLDRDPQGAGRARLRRARSGSRATWSPTRRITAGPDQALYLYSAEDYAWWAGELGAPPAPGTFGENLTLSSFGPVEVRIGDRFRVGAALVEATAPRIPCATFATRMGEPDWVKRFAAARRPGYLRARARARRGRGRRSGRAARRRQRPSHRRRADGHLVRRRSRDPELLERLLRVTSRRAGARWSSSASARRRVDQVSRPRRSGVESVRRLRGSFRMRIVIRHDEAGQWWWTALGEHGGAAAISRLYPSRWECMRAVAELKVEGPAAAVTLRGALRGQPGHVDDLELDAVRVVEEDRVVAG